MQSFKQILRISWFKNPYSRKQKILRIFFCILRWKLHWWQNSTARVILVSVWCNNFTDSKTCQNNTTPTALLLKALTVFKRRSLHNLNDAEEKVWQWRVISHLIHCIRTLEHGMTRRNGDANEFWCVGVTFSLSFIVILVVLMKWLGSYF